MQNDLATTVQACVRVAGFEILAMAANAGLPPWLVIDAINDSTGQSAVSQFEMPAVIRGDASDPIVLAEVQQSINRVIKAAASVYVPMPLATQTQSMLVAARNRYPKMAEINTLAQAIAACSGALLREAPVVLKPVQESKPAFAVDALVVGCIGLGVMGTPLAMQALHLAKEVYVYDIHPENIKALVDLGAKPCRRLEDLARHCDIVLICVPGEAEVRTVVFAEHGLLAGLSPGKILVDQTTGAPQATRRLSEELQALGVSLVDAPIAGGPQGIENGAFLSFLGGEDKAVQRVEPLLAAMGSKVVHFGGPGNGHAAKLVKNALAICNRFIVYEALSLALALEIPIDALAAAIQSGRGQTAAMQRVLAALYSGKSSATIRLELLAKDLGLICDMALDSACTMSLAGQVRVGVIAAVKALGKNANIDDIAQLFGLDAAETGTGPSQTPASL